jgi:hypothetical protein
MRLNVAIMVDRRRGHKVYIHALTPPKFQSLVCIHPPPLVPRSAKLLLLLLLAALAVWVGSLIVMLKCMFIGSW